MASDTRPLLTLHAVGKQFHGGVQALQGIDLTVRGGEIVTLLGPSGCGKSTLLRIVAGLAKPTGGEVAWSEPPRKGAIGFVFQEPTLMPWATARRNVEAPLKLSGVATAERYARATAALADVGLEEFADAYPRELSGGMKMRVAVARGLVTRPQILLMDEPFAALDEITRHRMNDDLLRICAETGLTVLFVTHSASEGVYLSDRVLVMSARPGRIVAKHVIAAPRPRPDGFRHSAEFGRYCAKILADVGHQPAAEGL